MKNYNSGSRQNKRNEAQARKYISFFSGALGLDIGLERAGLRCIALNEFDPITCRTIKANLGTVFAANSPRLYETDIRALGIAGLCGDLDINPGELFAVVGGPPCQAFSTAGRRLGLNDERGNVFLHFIDLMIGLAPKYAIFENVRGLLSAPLVHRPHESRGEGFPPLTQDEKPGGALLHILKRLEGAGYRSTFTLYNTANFGVPQIRERLIFFASREGKEVPLMKPTHDEHRVNGLSPWVTFREAVAGVRSTSFEAARFPESRVKYYRLLREGQNWRNLPQHVQKEAMGASWYAGGGKTGFYRRLAWDKPSPTLVTRPTMKATDLCHPQELRPLSVGEYAAIQTFPEGYAFEGDLHDQYRQIGNAVPCRFGAAIGRHIIAFDEGRLARENANVRLSRYDGTDHSSWRESVAWMERQLTLACK
jgi:DNA (cytosine-5)-methyltransferase 1